MKKLLTIALLLVSLSGFAQTDSLKNEVNLMLDRQDLFVKTHNAGIVASLIGGAAFGYLAMTKNKDESLYIVSGVMVATGYTFILYAPNCLRKKRK